MAKNSNFEEIFKDLSSLFNTVKHRVNDVCKRIENEHVMLDLENTEIRIKGKVTRILVNGDVVYEYKGSGKTNIR